MFSTKKRRGLLYLAFGEDCLTEAIESLGSFKRQHSEGYDSMVITDAQRAVPFDRVVRLDSSQWRGFIDKPRLVSQYARVFHETLFVDTDTYFVRPVDELFELLRV